jgi:hypothetical protein
VGFVVARAGGQAGESFVAGRVEQVFPIGLDAQQGKRGVEIDIPVMEKGVPVRVQWLVQREFLDRLKGQGVIVEDRQAAVEFLGQ